MGYAGLRIGEVEQLYWDDIVVPNGRFTMLHIRRGGSVGTTKDEEERFIPVHPTVVGLLGPASKKTGQVFENIAERQLLKRLKKLC